MTLSSSNMRLSEALDRTYNEHWRYGKDGLEQYRRLQKVVTLLSDPNLADIDSGVLEDLSTKLQAEGRALSTVNRYLAGLSVVFNLGVKKWKVIPAVPYFQTYKEPKGRIRWYTDEEEQAILDWFRNHDNTYMANVTVVLIDTGMRLSELITLNLSDVNFVTGLIHIWVNKGDRPRSVPMTPRVAEVLKHNLLPFGLTPNQVEKRWMDMRIALDLVNDKQAVIHTLRHTCASRLVMAGVDLYTVKEWLGHSSITQTEKYAHLAPQKLAGALNALQNRL